MGLRKPGVIDLCQAGQERGTAIDPYGLYEDGPGGLQYTSKRSCFSGKLGFAIGVSRQWVMILRARPSTVAQERVFYFI